MHCIMYGNPFDGFRIIGPFEDVDDAHRYLETDRELCHGNAWITEMDIPAGEGE
jgi:hypothetical protein